MIRIIFGFILSFSAGVLIGHFFPTKSSEQASPEIQKYNVLKTKFEKLSQVDLEEYVQLKNQKEKYEKADEIFGKILTIFLYDLGIRASHSQLKALEESSKTPVAKPEEPSIPVVVRSRNDQQHTVITSERNKNWITAGRQARELYSENEIEDFLKKTEISDFFSELKSARSLTQEQIQTLNGTYLGEIVFDDKSKTNWHVEMSLNGQVVNGELTGRSLIVLSENGKAFSTSRHRKRPENFQGFANDENAFLINVYGDKGYLQLYNMERMNMLSGLFYLSTGVGQFSKAGTVTLRKR